MWGGHLQGEVPIHYVCSLSTSNTTVTAAEIDNLPDKAFVVKKPDFLYCVPDWSRWDDTHSRLVVFLMRAT